MRVQEAHEILTDDSKRRAYEAEVDAWEEYRKNGGQRGGRGGGRRNDPYERNRKYEAEQWNQRNSEKVTKLSELQQKMRRQNQDSERFRHGGGGRHYGERREQTTLAGLILREFEVKGEITGGGGRGGEGGRNERETRERDGRDGRETRERRERDGRETGERRERERETRERETRERREGRTRGYRLLVLRVGGLSTNRELVDSRPWLRSSPRAWGRPLRIRKAWKV